jgi:two-component system, NarL family, response regulator LiaR
MTHAQTTPEKITLILCDDHALVRQGVRAFLETQPDIDVVAEAENGEQAIAFVKQYAPDVVLMDLLMSGMDGVEATRQIKRISPRSNVIVVTSYHDDEHIFPALRAGAMSYLLKSIKMNDLAEAVRRAARGEATLDPRVAARVINEVQSKKRLPNAFDELTERELEVLKLIASGIANHEIATRLTISEHTVKSYVSNILSKLHLADRTQAAIYAWREGVVRRE